MGNNKSKNSGTDEIETIRDYHFYRKDYLYGEKIKIVDKILKNTDISGSMKARLIEIIRRNKLNDEIKKYINHELMMNKLQSIVFKNKDNITYEQMLALSDYISNIDKDKEYNYDELEEYINQSILSSRLFNGQYKYRNSKTIFPIFI